MWFITEFLERSARTFARTVIKIAAAEADAQRRAFVEARTRRVLTGGLILPDRSLCVPASLALEPRVLPLDDAPPRHSALANLVEAAEASETAIATIAAARPGDVLATLAGTDGVVASLVEPIVARYDLGAGVVPMGVRADVVAKYVDAFASAAGLENAALIEKLRKDKKVRVAELQLIAAAVLGTEVVMRKKAEHLEALRRDRAPSERRRAAAAEYALHAG